MKKSRNLRRSKVAATEDEGQELGEAGTSPTRVAPEQVKLAQMQRLKQRKSEKKLSVLSFDDDGPEQDGPQRLKPLSTPVPLVMNPREAKAPSHTQMSAAGEYTAERIAELQRASKQLPKYAQVDSTMDNIDDSLVLLEEQGEEDGLFDEHEDSGLRARALRQRRKEAAHEPAMPMDGDLNVGMLDSQPPQSTLEQEPDDEEEGEEERIWAEDQIRKGISTKVLRAPEIHSKQLERTAKVSIPESTPRPVSVAALKEHHLSVMKASENALSSLHQAVARLQHSESQATKNLSKMKEKLIHSKSVVDQIEADLAFAGGKYMFFQKLVAYMSNLCTMLAEKSPIIETLEEESQSIMRERALAQYFKSIDSFHEDMDPIEAGIQAASTVLNHNAMSATAATANEAEAAFMKALEDRDAQIAGGKHIPVKLDEFGRDESSNRRLRSAARRKRRAVQEEVMAAKLYPSFKAQTAQVLEPEVGGETTSESEGEEDSFLQRKSEILGAAGLVFQDVVEEYASLEAVCAQLEGWKLKYPVQYEEVYMKLSMPVLVSPFVRLELLTWSPLFQGPQTVQAIRGQNWYGVLSKYGAHSVEKKPESDSDLSEEENYEGRDVICKLVQALILPQATFLVRDCWNPYSAEDSLAIASMLTEILQYVPQNSEEWRTLVSEVNDQLDKSISRLKVPAWSDATIEACGKSRSRVLYHSARCFGRALRVLRSVCAFQDVLGYSPVHNLAISRIVVALLVPYALSSPYHGVKGQRVKRIVESLPQNWVLVEGGVESCGLKGALTSLQEAAQLLLHETGKPEHVNTASHVASALDKLGEGSLALQLRLGFGG